MALLPSEINTIENRFLAIENALNSIQIVLSNVPTTRQLNALLATLNRVDTELAEDITQISTVGDPALLEAHKVDVAAHMETDIRYDTKYYNKINTYTKIEVDGLLTGPAGTDTQVQFNNSGAFGGSANLTWDGSTFSTNGDISVKGQVYQGLITTYTPTGTTQIIDWNNGNVQTLDLESASGNVTLTLNNPKIGATYILKIIQDSTVDRNVVWPASVLWQGGTVPVISTTNDGFDIITLLWDGTQYLANYGGDYL